jgi:hypothetical protein
VYWRVTEPLLEESTAFVGPVKVLRVGFASKETQITYLKGREKLAIIVFPTI